MTLTKKKMVREIGRRTRLTNREVQEVVEALVDVWTEALADGEKIEVQNFFVLEVKEVNRNHELILNGNKIPLNNKVLVLRCSKKLKRAINN